MLIIIKKCKKKNKNKFKSLSPATLHSVSKQVSYF
jgi:hypothetical protein